MNANTSSGIAMKSINEAIVDCPDIIRKKIFIENRYEAFFLYIRELTDNSLIQRDFIIPVTAMTLE